MWKKDPKVDDQGGSDVGESGIDLKDQSVTLPHCDESDDTIMSMDDYYEHACVEYVVLHTCIETHQGISDVLQLG